MELDCMHTQTENFLRKFETDLRSGWKNVWERNLGKNSYNWIQPV